MYILGYDLAQHLYLIKLDIQSIVLLNKYNLCRGYCVHICNLVQYNGKKQLCCMTEYRVFTQWLHIGLSVSGVVFRGRKFAIIADHGEPCMTAVLHNQGFI